MYSHIMVTVFRVCVVLGSYFLAGVDGWKNSAAPVDAALGSKVPRSKGLCPYVCVYSHPGVDRI